MTRQAWAFLVGAVALQACLNVSKTDASPSALVHDNMGPVTERVDGAEERGPFRPMIATPADILYNQIVKTKDYDKTLFTSEDFHDWYDEMMKYYGPSKGPSRMVSYLTQLFGVTPFQHALNFGKLNGGGHKTLSIENAQLKYWKKQEMTALGLFKLLLIKGQMEQNASWDTWEKYVHLRYPGKDPYGVLILEAYTSYDEKAFTDFIMQMWMFKNRKLAEVAIYVKTVTWQREGLSEHDVYKLLELDKTDAPLFSGVLPMWIFYTQRLGLDTNAKLFSHLQECYKEEAELANAVLAYETVGEGYIDGTLTENLLMHWSKLGKSPEDVVKLISLDGTEHRRYKFEMLKRFCSISDSKRCFDLNHVNIASTGH